MMSRWIIKAFVQKGISYLPASRKINYFFQKNVTGGVHLSDEHFGLKIGHARDHYGYMLENTGEASYRNILELGTGWYPVIPILFYLTGAGMVTSVDIQQWMTRQTQQDTILKYRQWKEDGLLDELEEVIKPERWDLLMAVLREPDKYSKDDINQLLGFTPLVADARKLSLENESVDFICSNNTFEHIPREILESILLEFKRVLKPGGAMSHFIDMSDHFAHFDSSITIYNFLKFSSKTWGILDNSIQPQNRLRHRDYIEMYHRARLPVSHEEIREGNLQELESVEVHPEFSSYSMPELAISHSYIISRGIILS